MKQILIIAFLIGTAQAQTDSIQKYGNGMYLGSKYKDKPNRIFYDSTGVIAYKYTREYTDTFDVFILFGDTMEQRNRIVGNTIIKQVVPVYSVRGYKVAHLDYKWRTLRYNEYLTEDKKTLKNVIIFNTLAR